MFHVADIRHNAKGAGKFFLNNFRMQLKMPPQSDSKSNNMTLKRISSLIFIIPLLLATHPQSAPAFKDIKDPVKRKNAFIEFLSDKVDMVNSQILANRAKVSALY